MYKTVLFDLDGTLIDHVPAIHRCYVHTLPQLGLPAPTEDQVRKAIGGGAENALRKFVTEEQFPRAYAIYRKFWDQSLLDGVSLLPGASELLSALDQRGCILAVLTNKFGESSRALCEHLNISHHFKMIVGAKDTPWLKPQAELSLHMLKVLDAAAATTCFVGDSPWDIEAAHNGKFACYTVATGSHTASELTQSGADGVYADLAALGRSVFAPL